MGPESDALITATDRPDTTEPSRTVLPAARVPATHSCEFTAPADGDAWVGLRKAGDSDTAEFSLDTFTVTDLGPATA